MIGRRCIKCNKDKEIDDFKFRNKKKGIYNSVCKECSNLRDKEWRENNIEKIRENDIPDCVKLIRKSFATVAEQFGITVENAPRFTAFATTEERLLRQFTEECRPMYAFRPAGQWLISSRSPPPSFTPSHTNLLNFSKSVGQSMGQQCPTYEKRT